MTVSEATYLSLALEDPEGHWELVCGHLRRKPATSAAHNHVMSQLFGRLFQQVDSTSYAVRSNAGHIRKSSESYYIPDVYVVPIELERAQMDQRTLEVYATPVPLVVEVWSPSTGDYDVETKLGEYQQRGDLEIWRIHPYERTLTSWVRQADGSYLMRVLSEGSVTPVALDGVTIELAKLFG